MIIDEIQNYYSNRDFATTYSKRVIDYITKNRHYGWTLVWMSQSVEAVDVTFRRNTGASLVSRAARELRTEAQQQRQEV